MLYGYCCETMYKKFHLVEFIPFACVLNEFLSCECWVKKVRIFNKKVTKIRVSEIRVSKIRVREIRVREIRVREIRVSEIRLSEIRISSNYRELHGAIFWILWPKMLWKQEWERSSSFPSGVPEETSPDPGFQGQMQNLSHEKQPRNICLPTKRKKHCTKADWPCLLSFLVWT